MRHSIAVMTILVSAVCLLGACDDDDDTNGSSNISSNGSVEADAEVDNGSSNNSVDAGVEEDTDITNTNPEDADTVAEDAEDQGDDAEAQNDDASDNSNGATDTGTEAIGTSSVLCGLQETGEQRLVYDNVDPRRGTVTPVDETFTYAFAWNCDDENRNLTGNGVPDHDVTGGEFATRVSVQNVSVSFTLAPEVNDEVTSVRLPGYALNSVKFDPATAGTCPDNATSDADCNYAMGSDMWSMVATPGNTSPWRFDFGVDANDAHVQPSGAYHYHGNPVGLVEKLNPDAENSMTLVGWASDGFPIYALVGYSDPQDTSSEVVRMTSSYQVIDVDAVPQNRPSLDDFPLGHFVSDWVFVEGSGTLDVCNGRVAVTPEFPQGIYHYTLTDTYPFVHRCVRGTPGEGTTGRP